MNDSVDFVVCLVSGSNLLLRKHALLTTSSTAAAQPAVWSHAAMQLVAVLDSTISSVLPTKSSPARSAYLSTAVHAGQNQQESAAVPPARVWSRGTAEGTVQ